MSSLKYRFVPIFLILTPPLVMVKPEPIALVPKMVRRPTHLDHYLCRQLHNGLGVRSHAVTNLSGDLCRTYCRVIDRMSGTIAYSENISPNFVRCGPYQARCVDGNCVGFNYNSGIISNNLIPPSSAMAAATTTGQHNNDQSSEQQDSADRPSTDVDNLLVAAGSDKSSSSVQAANHQGFVVGGGAKSNQHHSFGKR